MEDGTLTDVIDSSLSLQGDVACILLDCRRDHQHLFAAGVTDDALTRLADRVARQLGPLIGGRYVSHRYAMERMERAQRDAAVWAAFTGDNYAALQRRFGLSRRLVYSIVAQQRKRQLPQ